MPKAKQPATVTARPDPRKLDSLGRPVLDPPATADEVKAAGIKCGDSQEMIDAKILALRGK